MKKYILNFIRRLVGTQGLHQQFDVLNDKLDAFFISEYKASGAKRDKVVYTCMTGSYDKMIMHGYINFDYDYVCFTDDANLLQAKTYGVWQFRPLEYTKLDNTRNSRWHKIHPHILFPEYVESVWVDSNINVRTGYLFTSVINPTDYMKIQHHHERFCIYDEGKAVKNCHIENDTIVDKMLDFLKAEGFPRKYGLNDTSIIYRKHTDARIMKVMDEWWYFVENYSKRDQLSLSYVLWKNNLTLEAISFPSIRSDYKNFTYFAHAKSRPKIQ
jgi:hypothetical protein